MDIAVNRKVRLGIKMDKGRVSEASDSRSMIYLRVYIIWVDIWEIVAS